MQEGLTGRTMDLLQFSSHHVFSDTILTILPPQALCKLQATCKQLHNHIKDLPEAIWVQAAHGQLPAHHPVFSSSKTVREYLRLHYDIHMTFSASQTPARLAGVSVSWFQTMTISPDFSRLLTS